MAWTQEEDLFSLAEAGGGVAAATEETIRVYEPDGSTRWVMAAPPGETSLQIDWERAQPLASTRDDTSSAAVKVALMHAKHARVRFLHSHLGPGYAVGFCNWRARHVRTAAATSVCSRARLVSLSSTR